MAPERGDGTTPDRSLAQNYTRFADPSSDSQLMPQIRETTRHASVRFVARFLDCNVGELSNQLSQTIDPVWSGRSPSIEALPQPR
jgi:hypothetical protein